MNSDHPIINDLEIPFNYDLDRIKECFDSPEVTMPKGLEFDEFLEWISNNKTHKTS